MKAIGYTRVSTEGQAFEGVSLEAQKSKIAMWAEFNDCSEVIYFEDAGITGTSIEKRSGLQAAINALNAGDALIVYSLSRLSRSTRDAIDIADVVNRKGANLVSLTEKIDTTTAMGKFFFTTMAALAQLERDQVAERTSAALQFKKSKNERVGSIPYGKRLAADGVHLEDNPAEQKAIKAVKELRDAGLSLRKVAAILETRGMLNRNGKRFNPNQIRIIENA